MILEGREIRETPSRLLLVDDDEDSRTLMAHALRSAGHLVIEAADGAEALALDLGAFDVVLTDLQMPGRTGRDVLDAVRRVSTSIPVIVFTAYANAQSALDLMAVGAYDYLPRPVEIPRLRLLVQRAVEWRKLVEENNALKRNGIPVTTPSREQLLVGISPAMMEVYKVVAQVAPTMATVLIAGEHGTGKELVARTIHTRSGRTGPFVTVNCSALPEAALAHDLFGYEPGAVPAATTRRRGLFEEAEGGTVFLDEIDEITPKVQAQLLRVITDRAVTRLGSTDSVRVDVRLIAASSRDMASEVSSGRFREDLLFRLQVVTLEIPPLTARRQDLPLLIDHFIHHYAGILGRPVPVLAPDARHSLMSYTWPGNVRELAQTVERAMVLAHGNAILVDDLPSGVRHAQTPVHGTDGLDTDWPTLSLVERRYIDRVLQHTGGNKTRAAEVLGIDRRTLSRLFARERGVTPASPPEDHPEESTADAVR